jgi:hypothetical protein
MFRYPLIALLALLGAAFAACAQDFAYPWQPRSGDAWVDAQLADINQYGARWPNTFTDELIRYHHAPRDLVETLLQQHWAPGDIYYACALAEAAGRPCRAVVEDWKQQHAEGWGAVAQRLGVAPGSPAFHQLKRAVVSSYDRWGRPLRLDDTLRADFPGRDDAPSEVPAPPEEDVHGHEHAPPARPSEHGRGERNGHGHSR